MYFCPCSCNDPVDPDLEDSTFIALPRNLSYVQDSYLDRYSVSARYVHNPKVERRLQDELSLINTGAEVDETVGLLSVIKAQDYPVSCGSNNVDSFTSVLAPTNQIYIQPESPPFNGAFSLYSTSAGKPSGGFCSTLLGPASKVTSKLTSLLHSPSKECMDAARDIGSSVDGDLDRVIDELQKIETLTLEYPYSLGEDMDRGVCEEGTSGSPTIQKPNNLDEMTSEDTPNVIFSNSDDESDEQTGENCSDHRCFEITSKEKVIMNCVKVETIEALTNIQRKERNTPSLTQDSDEEGVFLNMDELDNTEKSTTNSEISDACVSVDSVFLSPMETELEAPLKMSLEEAINRAASDLSKLSATYYGESSKKVTKIDCESDEEPVSINQLAKAARESPIKYSMGLKLNINEQHEISTEISVPASKCESVESPVYSENEFNFNKGGLRKSSSLKTNKTPPGTPHRKKVVRFADAMGLDLESVRHVLNMESPPRIPASAMADLKDGLSEERKELGSKYLCACFNQPGASETFVQKVIAQKVCLENAMVNGLTITGFIRVSNVSFHKSVRVRYTHNSWATFHDIAASYVQNSCDGPTDRFSFSIVAPPFFGPGAQLEFAISFSAGGVEFWDNNDGKNYVFECFAKTVPTGNETEWLHFL